MQVTFKNTTTKNCHSKSLQIVIYLLIEAKVTQSFTVYQQFPALPLSSSTVVLGVSGYKTLYSKVLILFSDLIFS